MASGNPPRHSKGKDKPVTLDLSAEPTAPPMAGDATPKAEKPRPKPAAPEPLSPPISAEDSTGPSKTAASGADRTAPSEKTAAISSPKIASPAPDIATEPTSSASGPIDSAKAAEAGGSKPAHALSSPGSASADATTGTDRPAAAAAAGSSTAGVTGPSKTGASNPTASGATASGSSLAAKSGTGAASGPASMSGGLGKDGSAKSETGNSRNANSGTGSGMASGTGGIASGVSGASTVSGASGASASSSPRPAPAASGSTSRLVASGALGGIVALLLAGALQYGGVLPALGPGGGSGNGSTGGDPAEVSDLSARLQSLEQKVDALPANPQGGSDPALAKRVAALEDQRAAAPADAGSGSGAGIDDQELAGLRSQIEALRRAQSEAVETMSGSQAALSQRLEAAETNLNQPRQDVAVARAIAAAGLKAAIDRGGPFQAELETYSHAAADDAALPVLKSFAETGVPSRGELIRQVPSVASSIVKSAEPAASDASWGQRLLDSARGLVTIRPVGNVEGDSVPDIAARLEDKVKNGDLPGAAEEWNRLPEPSKQASAAFKQSLDARIRVEDLISGSLSQAVSKTVQETAQ